MVKNVCFTIFLPFLSACLMTTLFPEVNGARRQPQDKLILNNGHKMLFVFGDSYADTGNWSPKYAPRPWKEPYGMTFPGKPSGRWSDGRVLTDYIAAYMGIGSPQPYGAWKGDGEAKQNGMIFAYGGTGVFDSPVGGPNLTTQINYLQQLFQENEYTKHDLTSSVALVTSSGNDYGHMKNVEEFVESITKQLSLNIKRIHEMGVSRVGVTTMPPLGCLPFVASSTSSYPDCNENANNISRFQNEMLKKRVEKLNNQTDGSPFVVLDLYAAFMSAMNIQHNHPGKSSFPLGLQPCCAGRCGEVDESGKKEYAVCDDPKTAFFWDVIHPSQQGWLAVYSALKSSLHALLLPHLFHSQ